MNHTSFENREMFKWPAQHQQAFELLQDDCQKWRFLPIAGGREVRVTRYRRCHQNLKQFELTGQWVWPTERARKLWKDIQPDSVRLA